MSMRISAKKLIHLKPQDVLNNLTGEFTLVCDDGEIQTNAKHVYISSFMWRIIRYFDRIPFKVAHILTHHLPLNGTLKADSHVKILAQMAEDFYEHYPNYTHHQQHALMKLMMRSSNAFYNEITQVTERYMGSFDILDIIEIIHDDDVQTIKREGEYTQKGIKKIHQDILEVIRTKSSLKGNMLARLLRAGLIKPGQLSQSIGPWGYPTDVDSFPFPKPIIRGYAEGIRSFYESLTESRTAALALQYADSPLKNTEYFSRKTQFLGTQVATVHPGDCGSTHYHPRKIADKIQLEMMDGIWIWDREKQALHRINKKTDEHLIGRIVEMRNVHGCLHEDPNGVCATCYGDLSRNIFVTTNAGHQNTTSVLSRWVQDILSTKHLVGSGETAVLQLDKAQQDYFELDATKMGYKLRADKAQFHYKLTIPYAALRNITDALTIKDLKNLSPDRVTEIKELLVIQYDAEGNSISERLDLEYQGRKAFMTRDLLAYMKVQSRWNLNKKGNYDIDLSEWDREKTLFKIPPKQYSTVAFAKRIETLLESRAKNVKDREQETFSSFFEELIETVFERRPYHLSVLQMVAYGCMITNMQNHDGALPKPWSDSAVGVLRSTMRVRSLSPAMAFQDHDKTLTAATTFNVTNRPDHMFDWILLPQEVAKYRQVPYIEEVKVPLDV